MSGYLQSVYELTNAKHGRWLKLNDARAYFNSAVVCRKTVICLLNLKAMRRIRAFSRRFTTCVQWAATNRHSKQMRNRFLPQLPQEITTISRPFVNGNRKYISVFRSSNTLQNSYVNLKPPKMIWKSGPMEKLVQGRAQRRIVVDKSDCWLFPCA